MPGRFYLEIKVANGVKAVTFKKVYAFQLLNSYTCLKENVY